MATLMAERRRRQAAEAEVARLRRQLVASGVILGTPLLSPLAAQQLAQVTSQLQQTEQQLEDEQELVRQVIDISPTLVYVQNEAGQCILANKRYEQLLSRLAPGALELDARTGLDSLSPSFETTTTFEESYELLDGQRRWYNTTRSPLIRSDGSRYLLSFSSDITELKRLHQVAEEAGRAKQVFLANMSHEFRTPLHGVMGLAELLQKGNLSGEQGDYVDMILYSTEHLLMVIDDVLDFTKVESGEINLESIPFDLLKTVQQAVRSFTFKTAEKGLLLRVQEPAVPLPLVQGDPYRLHQILVNLLGNAVKFTPHGTITVTVELGEQTDSTLPVTLSITDTGIGISADNLDQLFTIFRQANSSIPRLYGGTGLGLTICKSLVELQGGEIGVHSAPGQGSCFYFTIPYAVSDQLLLQDPVAPPSPDLLRGRSALVVEDNAINQLLAVSMLGQWEMEVELAQSGEEALARAYERRYDLILMDIQMPEMDGIEAASRLRQQVSLNKHTPIVAVTADAIRINADSCQALGFTDFLLKPYTEAALHQLLVRVSSAGQVTASEKNNLMVASTSPPSEIGLYYDFLSLGRLGTDPEFLRKLLEMFIAQVPVQVQALQEAVKQEDWLVMGSEAHKLKTSFGNLNIQPATNYLKRLEEVAEQPTARSEVHFLLTAVIQAVQQYTNLFLKDLNTLPLPS